jgi:hypothetical protein
MKSFADCPKTLTQDRGDRAVNWLLDPAFAAQPDAEVDERFHLVPAGQSEAGACPVYRQTNGDAVAVANGRLFVRLHDDQQMQDFVTELQGLGLVIVRIPTWAPHTAWVAALDNNPCPALQQLPALQQHDAVAHAEAQLLFELQHR